HESAFGGDPKVSEARGGGNRDFRGPQQLAASEHESSPGSIFTPALYIFIRSVTHIAGQGHHRIRERVVFQGNDDVGLVRQHGAGHHFDGALIVLQRQRRRAGCLRGLNGGGG